jgi:hypothetical protein
MTDEVVDTGLGCEATTQRAVSRDFYGSDGTRTRDLRRDRPNRAQRLRMVKPIV